MPRSGREISSTLPGITYRLVLIGEKEINGEWMGTSTHELVEISPLDSNGAIEMVEHARRRYKHSGVSRRTARMSTALPLDVLFDQSVPQRPTFVITAVTVYSAGIFTPPPNPRAVFKP
jgi:hypothetical protein